MDGTRGKRSSFLIPAAVIVVILAVGACTTERESSPQRTATEQLMISAAADRAAQKLALDIPKGTRIFIDATNFAGIDGSYAVGAIREHFLKRGARLATARSDADIVVEVRSGALSIDEQKTLLGIPQFDFPVPLAGELGIPEIPLFKREQRKGVAKVAAVGFRARDGSFVDAAESYGFSHETEWALLVFISWTTDDIHEGASHGELRWGPQ